MEFGINFVDVGDFPETANAGVQRDQGGGRMSEIERQGRETCRRVVEMLEGACDKDLQRVRVDDEPPQRPPRPNHQRRCQQEL